MDGKLRNMASLYIKDGERLLLLYRVGSRVVDPSWCGVGGHFEKDELNDAKACVLREVKEEMGISEGDLENLRLRYVTLRLKNGEIRQNYFFFADRKPGAEIRLANPEGTPEWFALEKIPELPMPFTARFVLLHYLEVGRHTGSLYGGCAEEAGVTFREMKEF